MFFGTLDNFMPTVTLGQFIKECRQKKGISLRKLAKAVGISPTMMSKIEHDEKGFKAGEQTLVKIADSLDVNSVELLARAGKIPSDVKEVFLQEPQGFAKLLRFFKTDQLTGNQKIILFMHLLSQVEDLFEEMGIDND